MTTYNIIDEPKVKPYEYAIVDPIIIFFAAIFVPLLLPLPIMGHIWMPLLWLSINSFLLGSPSFKREICIAILGFFIWYIFLYACVYIMNVLGLNGQIKTAAPYLIIINQGIFYLILYLLVFIQRTPFSIYQYIKQQNARL